MEIFLHCMGTSGEGGIVSLVVLAIVIFIGNCNSLQCRHCIRIRRGPIGILGIVFLLALEIHFIDCIASLLALKTRGMASIRHFLALETSGIVGFDNLLAMRANCIVGIINLIAL